MIIKVEVRGAKRISRDFRERARELDGVTLAALADAAKMGQEAIARKAPKSSGRLAASIAVENKGRGKVRIFPKGTHYYAGVQERGGTHYGKRGRPMAWRGGGGWIFAKRVRIPASPYFYSGFESVQGRVFARIEKDIDNWLARSA